jgi:hypothetical protein
LNCKIKLKLQKGAGYEKGGNYHPKLQGFASMCFQLDGIFIQELLTSKSISSCAQYVTLQKYFSYPSLAMYFFQTPPIKLVLQIGRRLLKATHLNQSNYLTNQQQVIGFVVLFTNLLNILREIAGPKPVC